MKTKQLICASIIASATSFAGSALAEPTLWGIYDAHNRRQKSGENSEARPD